MTTQEMPKQALAQLRHQLRTPLNHIIGYSEILLEDAANESAEVRSLLTNVHTSARVILDLVQHGLAGGTQQQPFEASPAAGAYDDQFVGH